MRHGQWEKKQIVQCQNSHIKNAPPYIRGYININLSEEWRFIRRKRGMRDIISMIIKMLTCRISTLSLYPDILLKDISNAVNPNNSITTEGRSKLLNIPANSLLSCTDSAL